MKRLASHTVANRLEKRLVLSRETLRRLGSQELERAVGATVVYATCNYPCVTGKQVNNSGGM